MRDTLSRIRLLFTACDVLVRREADAIVHACEYGDRKKAKRNDDRGKKAQHFDHKKLQSIY